MEIIGKQGHDPAASLDGDHSKYYRKNRKQAQPPARKSSHFTHLYFPL
jgi:hypothetical protein